MALVFNGGSDKELVVVKAFFVNYYNTNWSSRDGSFPVETPVPFNIMPLVNAFRDDNSREYAFLFTHNGTRLGLRFSQQNDIIIAEFGGYVSSFVSFTEIGRFQIGTFPASYNMYFFYCNHPNIPAQAYSYLYYSVGSLLYLIGCADIEHGGHKIQQVGIWSNETYDNAVVGEPIPTPYNLNGVRDDVSFLDYFPTKIVFGPNSLNVNTSLVNSIAGVATINAADLSGLTDGSGDEPTPPTPPTPPSDDPNDEGEPSDEDGGDGDHDPIFDPIPIPNKPTQGASTAGFLTMYKLSQGHMQQFGEDMFASNVWEAIKLFFSNPMDFLVGIMLLPFEPTGGSSYKPKFGAISFARAYPTVANQYHDIDCGSINITKYWGSFLDYAPYTKIQIWLPYIGYRDLDVDEIMGSTINVKYRCDCVTGDCVAFVYVGVVGETGPQIPRVLAQFYGNCGVQIPFGSVTYDQAVMAGIEMLGTAANWGLSGGSAMLDSESFAAYNVNAVNASKPEVQKGGGAGSTVGYMSIQKPYIIRKIARQNLPADYMHFKGYPSNISGKLADFEGFARVDDIQLNNIPAMETEREEIISLLRGGVLL